VTVTPHSLNDDIKEVSKQITKSRTSDEDS
jgi:hypothetical protein